MSWRSCNNILAIRLDNMGDLVMTTPALQALKQGNPRRKITLLGSPQNKKIAPFIPAIDEFVLFEHSWMNAAEKRSNIHSVIQQLTDSSYDGAIVFQPYNHNPLPAAMIAYLAGIPQRAALCRENPFHLLTDWYPDPEPTRVMKHEVLRQLDLVNFLGFTSDNDKLSLAVPAEGSEEMRQVLQRIHIDHTKPFIIIHPGASEELRRYPAPVFIDSGKVLAKTYPLIITGTESEAPLVNTIVQAIGNNAYACTQLSLAGCIALIDAATLLISNNTGPVHIAAAMQTPVVDLFPRPNSPLHTPWNVPHRLLFFDTPCKSCQRGICNLAHDYDKKKIMPEAIVDAAEELLHRE